MIVCSVDLSEELPFSMSESKCLLLQIYIVALIPTKTYLLVGRQKDKAQYMNWPPDSLIKYAQSRSSNVVSLLVD
jgi:hypothetical protein